MDSLFIILFGIAALALIIFLVIRNQKDEKQFENQLKNDYQKLKDEEDDIEIDEIMKWDLSFAFGAIYQSMAKKRNSAKTEFPSQIDSN